MSGCSERDLHGLFQKYVSENSWRENLTITNVRCYKGKELWEDIPAVVSLCIIFLLMMLVAAGTIYEIIIRARRDGVKCSLDIHIGLNLNPVANLELAESGDLNQSGSISCTNNGTSDAQSGSTPDNTDQALTQETNNESSLDIRVMRSDIGSPLKSSADVCVGVDEEQDQDDCSVVRPLTSSADVCVGANQEEGQDRGSVVRLLKSSADVRVGVNEEQGKDSGSVVRPLTSSADVCVGVNEEQGKDSGSVVRPNEAKTRKSVKHYDLEIAAGQNDNATSDLANTANRSDALSRANNTANRSDAMSGANNTANRSDALSGANNTANINDALSGANNTANINDALSGANNTANINDALSGANNTANINDALSGANNTANRIPSVAASTNCNKKRSSSIFSTSLKSMLSHGSLFRRTSLPKMKKRHLPTQLSFADTKKTSISTVTLLQRLLITFSIRRNMTNVFGKGHVDMLFCLNGIRVLGNSWIVMGSYFMTIYTNPPVIENHLTVSRFGQSIWGQFLINTSLSADTFFIISGALNVYNLMKAKAKSGCQNMFQVMSPAEYVWGVIHRLVRILPCYYMALMIHANLSGYLATERELRQQTDSTGHCRDNWWANVLFISNFYKADQMCMPWSYYLVIDLQLSILSPLVTIPLLCRPILGFVLLICLVGIQIVSVMLLNTGINGNSMRMNATSYFSDIYVKPYCRAGVYAIGLGLGYFLYSGDKKIRLRKMPLCAGWLLCLSALLLLPQITYLQYREGARLWSGFETSLYEALSRPTWGLAMSWLIFTCCNSQGGLISKCLSWNVFIPIARITYAVYVLHPILMEAVLVSTQTSTRVSFEHMTLGYISLVAGSWCLAICMILLVEQPFVQMEAVIIRHIHNKKT